LPVGIGQTKTDTNEARVPDGGPTHDLAAWHTIPFFGGDIRAIERYDNFWAKGPQELTVHEKEIRFHFYWERFLYSVGTLIFLKICRRRLINIEKETNPPLPIKRKGRLARWYRFLFVRPRQYLYLIPVSIVSGSILSMAGLNRVLRDEEEANEKYYHKKHPELNPKKS